MIDIAVALVDDIVVECVVVVADVDDDVDDDDDEDVVVHLLINQIQNHLFYDINSIAYQLIMVYVVVVAVLYLNLMNYHY
jgi:hypothetical protein